MYAKEETRSRQYNLISPRNVFELEERRAARELMPACELNTESGGEVKMTTNTRAEGRREGHEDAVIVG